MTSHYKVAGVWKQTVPKINVSSVWKTPKSAYIRINDTWKSWFLQGGINDDGFATYNTVSLGANGIVRSTVQQSDDKILIGGSFITFDSTTANRVARLETNGTLDTAFMTNIGTGANGDVNTIWIQSDGKILIGGAFTTFNGTTANRVARLNSDGTLDTSFITNIGTGANNPVNAIVVTSGYTYIGGSFTTFNGATVGRFLRLNSNGTPDTSFTSSIGTGFNNTVNAICVGPNFGIYVGGSFNTFNGANTANIIWLNGESHDPTFTTNVRNQGEYSFGSVTAIVKGASFEPNTLYAIGSFGGFAKPRNIVKFNLDGTSDLTFATNAGSGLNGTPTSLAVTLDRIYVGGTFTQYGFTGVTNFATILLNGSQPQTVGIVNNSVDSILVQSNGSIVVGGNFTTYSPNTFPTSTFSANRIVRISSYATGSVVDTNFGLPTGFGSSSVSSLSLQSDGKIIAVGSFNRFNRNIVNKIVRLNADGTHDIAFTTNTGTGVPPSGATIEGVNIQTNGKIILNGSFTSFNDIASNRIVRLNADGTRDTAFMTNIGTGPDSLINNIKFQSDGKIILVGLFNNFNETSANRIIRLNSDGTRDTAFTTNIGTGPDNSLLALGLQSDGKIILGASSTGLTTFNGTNVNYLLRLNSDGTLDTAFTTNLGTGFDSIFSRIIIQSDDKILIGGSFFTSFNGTAVPKLVRLNSDGTLDTAFMANIGTGPNSSFVQSINLQSDSKILIGGAFTSFNGTSANRIVRLNSDGTLDTDFITNIGTGANNSISATAIQSDGKIFIGGSFTSFNNNLRSYIARIGGDIAA
jgi:uncharacterized delta-60 repeat protein